jgi:hypothetical protein
MALRDAATKEFRMDASSALAEPNRGCFALFWNYRLPGIHSLTDPEEGRTDGASLRHRLVSTITAPLRERKRKSLCEASRLGNFRRNDNGLHV